MKERCPKCNRFISIQSKKDDKIIFFKHRVKVGSKNRRKETRYPYCK